MVKSKFFVVTLLLASVSSLFAQGSPVKKSGPFGFERGMTKEQLIKMLGQSSIKKDQPEYIIFTTAPKPHAAFESYAVYFSPKEGLLKVLARSKNIDTTVYGSELKNKFLEFETALNAIYGAGKQYDFLRHGSIWNEPRDWMMGLIKNERTLSTFWDVSPSQFNHVYAICLEANASSREQGVLWLSYEFEGWKEHVQQRRASENSAF